MDAAYIFRQGLGTVAPRQNQTLPYAHHHTLGKPHPAQDDLSDSGGYDHRVAHTLTACCRCRQRKTRCDPALPRCLPCERSGSKCEYFDAARGRKISRNYVIKLQDQVRALEAELEQYTDDGGDYPRTTEDMVRPGGMIRLSASDETPRYLGPSSGIAMSRLLMEEAKRYTDSKRISDLIPEVRARRQARMQSIQMTGRASHGKKSYPMVSDGPAESLPARNVTDKLVEMFNQKAQLFWPTLHEEAFLADLDAVYNGDKDTYRNFVVRMVIAISLQKLDTQYAGLADSYYLAAMQYVETMIRPKDLKTLQCLVLIAQYSLLTPTRVPVYYVIGLATRICQQEGLTDEQTIKTGYNLDPQAIDMRRRLVWIVAAMEFGLAHAMGRPSSLSKSDDRIDVDFFATVDDSLITKTGIKQGPPSERKAVAIHFFKMRMCQAEIRAALYEKKRREPKDDSHPWYERTETQIKEWLDASPEQPSWCRPWFTGRYHQMKVFMYRPSPQVPKPSSKAANICFDSSAFIIQLSKKQMDLGAVDVTWVYMLTLNMSLNTLLWATSYLEVRQAHSKEEVEDLINTVLDVIEHCADRWPGTSQAAQLYAVLSKACLQSYDAQDPAEPSYASSFASPPTIPESTSSPDALSQSSPYLNQYHHQQQQQQQHQHQQQQQQPAYLQPPQFGQVFDSPPEAMNAYPFDPNFPQPHPTFRSNSIFRQPATTDNNGRRFSYFPPDFTQAADTVSEEPQPFSSGLHHPNALASSLHTNSQLPSPPDSLPAKAQDPTASNTAMLALEASPLHSIPTAPPVSLDLAVQQSLSPAPKAPAPQQASVQPGVPFSAPQASQASIQQQPLPATTTPSDWFNPSPFMSHGFGNMNGNLFADNTQNDHNFADLSAAGLGLQGFAAGSDLDIPFHYPIGRQGSLSQSQQVELMNVLETEGMCDIDAFLNAESNMAAAPSWQ